MRGGDKDAVASLDATKPYLEVKLIHRANLPSNQVLYIHENQRRCDRRSQMAEEEWRGEIMEETIYDNPDLILLICLNCEAEHWVTEQSYEARGVFNMFCPNSDCEDQYAAKL